MDKRQDDVLKLVLTINKNADQKFIEDSLSSSQNYFNSYLGSGLTQQPQWWKNKIVEKVEQTWDSRTVLQCQQALTKFISNNSITKKSEILKMLFKLSERSSNSLSNQSFESGLASNLERSHKPKNANQTQATINLSATQNLSQNISQNINHSNIQQSNLKPKSMSQQLKIVRNRGSIGSGLKESDILAEIIYKIQGINTTHILSDNMGQSFLKSGIEVSDTVRKIVKELSEIGWLYNKIQEKDTEEGPITKALRLGVKQQMGEYYRWLAVMEGMIKEDELTLRKLVLWSYEPFEKLKWMAIVLEAVKPFKGCQIISIINSYRPQGSNSINQLLNRLLTHSLQPLFQYIYNWVYRGQLIDSVGEFFICLNKKKTGEQSKECFEWQNKFYLDEKNIPNLLDYESAVQIFNAGKTIYFLKNHCKIDYVLDIPFFDVKTAISDKLYQSTTILSANFKSWLSSVFTTSSNYLVEVMLKKFDLKKHFYAMKMFYLAGKGDFIQALIDSLKDQLSKPKHQIAEHNLERFISDAISQSFPKVSSMNTLNANIKKSISIQEQIIARLTAKKIENGPQGWDVFNFQYSVEQPPLNTVFSKPVIEKYQKIFNFLWKVKRVEQTLKQLWVSSVKDYRHDSKLPILHTCQILRHQMFHFANNLIGYLMISIESAWNSFWQEVDRAKCFDEILKLQQKLISELTQITLNDASKSKIVNSNLKDLFNSILTFASVQKELVQTYSQYVEKVKEYSNRKSLIEKGIQFGYELQPPYFNSKGLNSKLTQAQKRYRDAFKRFYEYIKKDSESRISNLGFRLDFSGYYSSQVDYNNL